jgi:hypothetical protein
LLKKLNRGLTKQPPRAYNKVTNKKGDTKMEAILNEMMEWGASTIELLREAGLTPEEITEALADE